MGATVAKYTLMELAERYQPSSDGANGPPQPASEAKSYSLPQLAKLYAAVKGNMAIVEQQGGTANITWSDDLGAVYGRSTFVFDAARQAFAGKRNYEGGLRTL